MSAVSADAERAERAALADLHRAADAGTREALGLHLGEIGGALVSIAARDPSTILNRAVGLGVERPAAREDVEAIMEAYASRGVRRYYLHLQPGARPVELRDWLLDCGLRKGRGWVHFQRGIEPPEPSGSPLAVRPIGTEHRHEFGRILAAAFELTAPAAGLLSSLVGRPGWHLFMSFDGEEPAGTGALFVHGDRGWLDWGSTHPGHRRKGGQRAVLKARISAAAGLGCRRLFTETGEAVEGQPQHSYRNIVRAGFEPIGVRENFIPVA